jgi:hypothetical protein
MTFRQKYESSKTWQKKIYVMSLYHHFALMRDMHWTIQETANYFHVSKSLVSENLKLALHMEHKQLLRIRTRREALVEISK